MKNTANHLTFKRALDSGDLSVASQQVRYLTLPELKSGMILASPLLLTKHSRSELRMPAGLVLSEATLGLLAGYRAACVCVYDPEAAAPAMQSGCAAGQEIGALPYGGKE